MDTCVRFRQDLPAELNPARTPPNAAAEQAATQRIIVKFRQSALSAQASKSGESAAAAADSTATRMTALANRTPRLIGRPRPRARARASPGSP